MALNEGDAAGVPIETLVEDTLRRFWMFEIEPMYPDLLDRLRAVRVITQQMELRQSLAVSDARTAGKTWQEIGDALGITRQAATKRYGYMG